MSGDGKNDVQIPLVFLFNRQGNQLKEALRETPDGLRIYMGVKPMSMGKWLRPVKNNRISVFHGYFIDQFKVFGDKTR